MKKILIAGLAICTLSANAQKTVPKKTTGTAAVKPLKNATDSLSYALGVSVATFYKQQGVKNLNTTVISKALNDVLAGKKTILNENQCNSIIMSYMQKADEQKSRPNIDEGQKFLAQNR